MFSASEVEHDVFLSRLDDRFKNPSPRLPPVQGILPNWARHHHPDPCGRLPAASD